MKFTIRQVGAKDKRPAESGINTMPRQTVYWLIRAVIVLLIIMTIANILFGGI